MKFNKKILSWAGLMLIVALSVATTVPFTLNHAWNSGHYDDARDILVAKHIVEHGTIVHRGPLADGGTFLDRETSLLNSPVYYYIIALFWFFSRSVPNILLNWTLVLAIFTPISSFYFGKKYSDNSLGLILALVTTFNPFISDSMIHIWQPNIAILLTFLTLGMFYNFLRKPTILTTIFTIFLAFLTLHIHYSGFLLILSLISIVSIHYYRKVLIIEKTKLKFLPYFFLVFTLLVWIGFTYKIYFGDQLYFFTEVFIQILSNPLNHGNDNYVSLLHKLSIPVNLTIEIIFSRHSISALLLTFLLILPLPEVVNRKLSRKNYLFSLVILLGALIPLLLFHRQMYDIYLIPVVCILFLRIAVYCNYIIILFLNSFGNLLSTRKKDTIKLAIVLFFLSIGIGSILLYYSLPFFRLLLERKSVSASIYATNKTFANVISSDSISIGNGHFNLAYLSGPYDFFGRDGWATAGLWLILEELSNSKLVTIITPKKNEATFRPIHTNTEVIYLICSFNEFNDKNVHDTNCLDRFIQKRNVLAPNYVLLYYEGNKAIYRFRFDNQSSANTQFDIKYE